MKLIIDSADLSTAIQSGIDTPVPYTVLDTGTIIEVKSERPITKLYWVLNSPHDGDLAVSYYDGSTFSVLTPSVETTSGMTVPGWIEWEKPTDDSLNGSYYHYKFTISGATEDKASTIRFAGIVFSEDKDLRLEYPNVMEYLPEEDTSFIRFHVSARDQIVQWFRGKGKYTYNGTESKNLTEWDFLDISEVNTASKFMALAKIFAWLSDSADDKWYQKSKDFYFQATNALDVYYLSIDLDRDGEADDGEVLQSSSLVIHRG